jgi:hypothetical protein
MKALTQREVKHVLFQTSYLNLVNYGVASSRISLYHAKVRVKFSKCFFRDLENPAFAIPTEFAKADLKISVRLLLETRAALLSETCCGLGVTDAR